MNFFKNMTIKNKITSIIMIISIVSIILSCLFFLSFSVYNQFSIRVLDLDAVASMISHNCLVPIAFNIPEDAEKVLNAFKEESSVVYACILDNENKVFADFRKTGFSDIVCLGITNIKLNYYESGFLKINHPIELNGKRIASLYIQSDLSKIYRNIRMSLFSLFVVLFVVSIVAYFIASKIQLFVSKPISNLSKIAREVSEKADYSIRSPEGYKDEMGILNASFNKMLSIIQKRDNEIRNSEKRYRKLLEGMIDGFVSFDKNWKVTECNKAFQNMLGYTNQELLSMTFKDITAPEYYELKNKVLKDEVYKNGYSEVYECGYFKSDLSVLKVEVRTNLLLDDNGNSSGMWEIVRDITKKVEAEEEKNKLEEQLRQSKKIEAIGKLAGGIAHDFNNFLSPIIGYAEINLLSLKPEDSLYVSFTEILNAGLRAKDLTKQLLAFGRKQVLDMKKFDLGKLVVDFERVLRSTLREDIIIQIFNESSGVIKGDLTQIQQILVNLSLNSQDAMSNGGNLTFEIKDVDFEDNQVIQKDMPGGKYVELCVSDNGCGIERKYLKQVFDPFFTTKELNKGTGLGLSTVHGIVKQHSGYIWLYSEKNIGTTFKIYFPRVQGEVEEVIELAPVGIDFAGKESVLIVEDNDMVIKIVHQILSRHGYNIFMAFNANDAAKILSENKDKIKLVISDVVMPGMNGRELVVILQKISPGLKSIFMSGYSEEVIAHHGILEDGINFIQKPIREKEFLTLVRNVLDDKILN